MTNTETIMRLRNLHNQLSRINEELSQSDLIDEDTVDALGQLVTDLVQIFDRAKSAVDGDDPDPPDHSSIQSRIESFESEHPRVVDFLSQITDTLNMMGI